MKRILLTAALLLAACDKAPTDPLYEKLKAEGYTPAEASQISHAPADQRGYVERQIQNGKDPSIQRMEWHRQKDLQDLHVSKCKADPVAEGC